MTNKYEAQQKYQRKVGLISKSYKLKKVLVDDFATTCRDRGKSQAGTLSDLMRAYIEKG